jgi:hypothetical protein
MDLCWYSGAEDIYKLEKEKIAEWHPAWNCKENKDYYRPTHKLDFVAFSVKHVSYYGVISKKRKKNVTYKDITRERVLLRKKTFAYGDIPRSMIKYESFLEELRLECPVTYKDLEIIMERRKKEGEDMSRYKVFKNILWRRENCGRIYRERYAGKGRRKYPENFTSIKDKLIQRHKSVS